jgi:polyphosphate glucokinase
MVERTIRLVDDWQFDHISLGVPAQVVHGQVVHDPVNLGSGWVGFDFQSAFDRPTKVVNDAVMQAIGSYKGGRMLFLGLETGLGSAFIVAGKIEPMELGHLPYRRGTFENYVGRAGRKRLGRKRWREAVLDTIDRLSTALEAESVVVGGGLAKELEGVPANVRVGSNELAFVGAFRLWNDLHPCRNPFRAPSRTRYRCNTYGMNVPQNRDGSGRWPRGVSGNPGGRPQGLAKATRELIGEDGMKLAQLWWDIARDETRRDRDRLEASRFLADRGWGKAPAYAAIEEEDPLGLEAMEPAAEEFRAAILRLVPSEPDDA